MSRVPKSKSWRAVQKRKPLSPIAVVNVPATIPSDNWRESRLPAFSLQDYGDDCCQLRRRPGTDLDFVALLAEEERDRAEWLASDEYLATCSDTDEVTMAQEWEPQFTASASAPSTLNSTSSEANMEESPTWSKLDAPAYCPTH